MRLADAPANLADMDFSTPGAVPHDPVLERSYAAARTISDGRTGRLVIVGSRACGETPQVLGEAWRCC
jgi:hypothetical protein